MIGLKNVAITLVSIESSHELLHDYFECFLVVKGNILIKSHDAKYHLEEDDIIIINPQEIYSVLGSKANILIHLRVEQKFLEQIWPEISEYTIECRPKAAKIGEQNKYVEIKRLLTKMLLVQLQKSDGYQFEFSAQFFQFMQYIYRHFRVRNENKNERTKDVKDFSIILNYIHNNYNQDITLVQLANMNYTSLQYFSKLFKQKTGAGFLQYLNRIRIDHAMSDLLLTNDSIMKIAMKNGFASTKSFTDSFKRLMEKHLVNTENIIREKRSVSHGKESESSVRIMTTA